jgi:Triose-phosphate Transporter family
MIFTVEFSRAHSSLMLHPWCLQRHLASLQTASGRLQSVPLCRVIVIVASVLFFRNAMSTQTAISTMVALLGVFAYSQAKRLTQEKK